MSKLKGRLQSSSGKIMDVQFPIPHPEFKKIIRELTNDDPHGTWHLYEFQVCSDAEGFSLERCHNLDELNYYGHIVDQFDEYDWGRYKFLLDAGVAEWYNLKTIINVAANINNYCLIENVHSYKDLGKILTQDDPNYADADDKTLRDLGKKYAKERHGKISEGYFVQKCPKSWKQIYDGNPQTIDPKFRLEERVGVDNV